jgi:hypothetical protein
MENLHTKRSSCKTSRWAWRFYRSKDLLWLMDYFELKNCIPNYLLKRDVQRQDCLLWFITRKIFLVEFLTKQKVLLNFQLVYLVSNSTKNIFRVINFNRESWCCTSLSKTIFQLEIIDLKQNIKSIISWTDTNYCFLTWLDHFIMIFGCQITDDTYKTLLLSWVIRVPELITRPMFFSFEHTVNIIEYDPR